MYLASGDRVVALRPETGEEIWRHEVTEGLASYRGLTYWPGAVSTAPASFSPRCGRLSRSTRGRASVIRCSAIRGKSSCGYRMPESRGLAGHLGAGLQCLRSRRCSHHGPPQSARGGDEPIYPYPRALDAKTGKLLWEFHTIPQESDFGSQTWGNESWRDRIGNNVWAVTLTVDEARGLVYMPVSGPGANFYGGDRPGDNLFGNSTVAIDIQTGELEWHFQNIHHELWDYNPATRARALHYRKGRPDDSGARAGRQVGVHVHPGSRDRRAGVWGRGAACAGGDVPGEHYSPTQPIPNKPPPVARVRIGRDDIVTAADTNVQHAAACRERWDTVGYYNDGPYTPLRLRADGTPPSLVFPGWSGGVNWGGTAYDPELGYILVNSKDEPLAGWMQDNPQYGPNTRDHVPYVRVGGPPFVAQLVDDNGTQLGFLPCFKPPWARLFAVEASTGEIAWEVPLGINEILPEGKQQVGSPSVRGPMVTAGGLTFIGATRDRRFRAFDTRTGAELWSVKFDYNVEAVPMTYEGRDGKQYVAVNVSAGGTDETQGHERLVVFGLPDQ